MATEISKQTLIDRWNVTERTIERLANKHSWDKDFINLNGYAHRTYLIPKNHLNKLDAKYIPQGIIKIPEVKKHLKLKETLTKLTKTKRCLHVRKNFDSKPQCLIPLGDLHLGSRGVNYSLLEDHIPRIASSEGAHAMVIGDIVDNFIIGKLSTVGALHGFPVTQQWEAAEEILSILSQSNSLWALLSGNHEDWTSKLAGIDPLKYISQNLNIPYHPDEIAITIHVGSQEYRIHSRHQFKGNSKYHDFQPAINLYEQGIHDMFDDKHPHIIILGHTHSLTHTTSYRNGKKRLFVVVGSYKTEDEHARVKGYQDAVPVMPAIIFYPNKYKFEVREDLEETLEEYLPWVRNRY